MSPAEKALKILVKRISARCRTLSESLPRRHDDPVIAADERGRLAEVEDLGTLLRVLGLDTRPDIEAHDMGTDVMEFAATLAGRLTIRRTQLTRKAAAGSKKGQDSYGDLLTFRAAGIADAIKELEDLAAQARQAGQTRRSA